MVVQELIIPSPTVFSCLTPNNLTCLPSYYLRLHKPRPTRNGTLPPHLRSTPPPHPDESPIGLNPGIIRQFTGHRQSIKIAMPPINDDHTSKPLWGQIPTREAGLSHEVSDQQEKAVTAKVKMSMTRVWRLLVLRDFLEEKKEAIADMEKRFHGMSEAFEHSRLAVELPILHAVSNASEMAVWLSPQEYCKLFEYDRQIFRRSPEAMKAAVMCHEKEVKQILHLSPPQTVVLLKSYRPTDEERLTVDKLLGYLDTVRLVNVVHWGVKYMHNQGHEFSEQVRGERVRKLSASSASIPFAVDIPGYITHEPVPRVFHNLNEYTILWQGGIGGPRRFRPPVSTTYHAAGTTRTARRSPAHTTQSIVLEAGKMMMVVWAPSDSINRDFVEGKLKSGGLLVIVSAGDMVFIPPGYIYATYFLHESITVSNLYWNSKEMADVPKAVAWDTKYPHLVDRTIDIHDPVEQLQAIALLKSKNLDGFWDLGDVNERNDFVSSMAISHTV